MTDPLEAPRGNQESGVLHPAAALLESLWVDGDGHVWEVVQLSTLPSAVVLRGRSTEITCEVVDGVPQSEREFSRVEVELDEARRAHEEGSRGCTHEIVWQFSTIYAKTSWSRKDKGYEPDQVPLSSVLDEDTDHFKCVECGVRLSDVVDDDGVVGMEDADGRRT